MTALPSMMEFGSARILNPHPEDAIPADLWPELELLILLEPQPSDLKAWERRLEDRLGTTATDRLASHPRAWNILCVSPLMERRVAETLGDEGLTVYVPIETYMPRPANVLRSRQPWRPRTRPLIPGYIFADLSDEHHLDIARANHAVRRIMCQDGKPVSIPSAKMAKLIRDEAAGVFDATHKEAPTKRNRKRGRRGEQTVSRWKSGQRVRVTEGPFGGFWGDVIRADGGDRIEVLVTIFGRETPITLDEAMIEDRAA